MIINSRHFADGLTTDWANKIPLMVERAAMQDKLRADWDEMNSGDKGIDRRLMTLGAPPPKHEECSPGKILFETDEFTLVVMYESDIDEYVLLAVGEKPEDLQIRMDHRDGNPLLTVEWYPPIAGQHRSKPLVRTLTTREREIEKLSELKYGDTVCDMHYGFHDVAIDVHKWIQMDCETSSDVLERILDGIDSHRSMVTNKHAVLIGEASNGWLQAAYSYDGRKFGMFEYTVCDD